MFSVDLSISEYGVGVAVALRGERDVADAAGVAAALWAVAAPQPGLADAFPSMSAWARLSSAGLSPTSGDGGPRHIAPADRGPRDLAFCRRADIVPWRERTRRG